MDCIRTPGEAYSILEKRHVCLLYILYSGMYVYSTSRGVRAAMFICMCMCMCMCMCFQGCGFVTSRCATIANDQLARPARTYCLLLNTYYYSPLTTHYSPLTTHYSLLTTHNSLLTTHYSPCHLRLTINHLLLLPLARPTGVTSCKGSPWWASTLEP